MSFREGTAIYNKAYNARALLTHRFPGSHNVVRTKQGVLWALIQTSTVSLGLYRSTDNGYSWAKVHECWESASYTPRSGASYIINGPCEFLLVDELMQQVLAFYIRRTPTSTWELEYGYYDMTGVNVPSDTDDLIYSSTVTMGTDGLFSACHNQHTAYFLYTYLNGAVYDLRVRRFSPRTYAISAAKSETTYSWGNKFDICCNDVGEALIACEKGAGPESLYYVKYIESSDTFGTPVKIADAPTVSGCIWDIAIARDGYDSLCVTWSETDDVDTVATTVVPWYATSVDAGTTWDENIIPTLSGYTPYYDPIMNGDDYGFTTRADVLGGYEGGFLLSYVQKNAEGVPKTLVRRLSTDDGAVYSLEDALEIIDVDDDVKVVGAEFFDMNEADLINLDEPGLARVACMIGEGNGAYQSSTVPIRIDQDVLRSKPYPMVLPSLSGEYDVETAGSGELLSSFEFVESTSNHIDFYDAGMEGDYTDKYLDSFEDKGTKVRLVKYDPIKGSAAGDRSGYDLMEERWASVFIDPLTSFQPQRVEDATLTKAYTAQDIRRIYLPPDEFLDRVVVLNTGNFLRKTIWVMHYDGNEYEVAQVVARFINNEITYYEANAYVISSDNDPFKTIRPLTEN